VRRLRPPTSPDSTLGPVDRLHLKSWGGHAGLAASGTAWAAFADDRPVAVVSTFLPGGEYEDIGVVTERPLGTSMRLIRREFYLLK